MCASSSSASTTSVQTAQAQAQRSDLHKCITGRPRDDRQEEADVRVLSFRADAGTVNPPSHNYR